MAKVLAKDHPDNCKGCGSSLLKTKDFYLLNRHGKRVCKPCGDRLIIQVNIKTPGKVKMMALKSGEKIIVLAEKK